MRVILHIGAEKTGTSSIQQFFRLNRETLRARDFLYSQVAGNENHMALAAAAQRDDKVDDLRMVYALNSVLKLNEFRNELREGLVAEAQSSECNTIIFSGEHCSSRLTESEEISMLHDILKRVSSEIMVVVYLRRQDDFLCSTYSTDVKSGSTNHFTLPPNSVGNLRYNYHLLLSRWSAVVGRANVVCRIYDNKLLANGDVIDDFCQIVGLPVSEDLKRPLRVNESLDIETLEFLRLFNAHVPRFRNGKLSPARGNVVQLLQGVSKGAAPTLPVHQMKEFMAQFAGSNAKVADEYFGRRAPIGDPLFGEAGDYKKRSEVGAITAEAAISIAAHLWQKKQEQVSRQGENIKTMQRNSPAQRRVPLQE